MKKIVFPGIAMIAVSYAFARFSFGLFLPEISESLHMTESVSGMIGSIAYIAYCMALLSSSVFIEKLGQRRVVLSAGLTAVVGMVGISLAGNVYTLAASVFLAGLSTGWASPAFGNVAVSELEEDKRDRGNTWINSGTSFGMVLAGPVALFFTEYWRLSYVLFAIAGFMVLLWNGRVLPERRQSGASFTPAQIFAGGKEQIKWLLLASLLTGMCSSVYWTFSRSLLTIEHQLPYHSAVLIWMVIGVSGVLGGFTGSVVERTSLNRTYRSAVFLLALSTALLTLPLVYINILSAVLFGLAYIALTGIFIVWSYRIYSKNPSIGISLSFLSLGAGQFAGSALGGYVIQWSSYTTAFLIFSCFGFMALLVKGNTQRRR